MISQDGRLAAALESRLTSQDGVEFENQLIELGAGASPPS